MQVFQSDSLLHLSILELDRSVAVVAVCVVVGKHMERLVVPVLGQQPTRGPAVRVSQLRQYTQSSGNDLLRNPPNECELNNGKDTLDKGRNSPGPGVGNVLSAKSQPATDQGTKVPQAVVDGCNPGTMLGMRNFGNKHRAGELRQGVAQTHKETGALVLWAAHGGGLNSGGDDHNDTPNSDRGFTTKSIAEEGHNGKRNDGTD